MNSFTRRITTACLLSCCLLLFTTLPARGQEANGAKLDAAKLDDGLDKPDQQYPVFVRFENQLFRKAGDYEAYCAKHEADKRTVLRKTVIETLRKNSEQSWATLKDSLDEWTKAGDVKRVERYWIVNGFACEATGKVCRELAELDSVAFVYRQRVPFTPPLHARPTQLATAPGKPQKEVYERVLAQWKDDSNQPLDVDACEIPWNVSRIRADQAWAKEQVMGQGVVVALCDSGLMVTPSLMRALWKNPDESLNGKDDDGNGYVDDVFGYDFAGQHWYALGDGRAMTHGSMCGGIIAGRPLNKQKLITGVAPRARLMPLRGMGLLKTYEYALMEGADVMSMSFMFIRAPLGNYRGLYRLAHEHLAAGGVVAVGGAGNFRRNKPAGQQIAVPKDIPCVIAAAGILKNGDQAPQSSEGPVFWENVRFYNDYPRGKPLQKPDVTGCFGGYPVWGRPSVARRVPAWKLVSDEGNGIGLVQGPRGNSFSGPHAAGVAALMLSANPELNAWQVKSLMEKTCTDIGDPGHDAKFGAGLLNALEAVRAAKQAR